MINLMEKSPGQPTLALDPKGLPVEIQGLHFRSSRALDHLRNSGDAETSLLFHLASLDGKDPRIDEYDELGGILSDREIHHGHAAGHADLIGGEAYPGSRVHRLHHVDDQLADLFIDLGDIL